MSAAEFVSTDGPNIFSNPILDGVCELVADPGGGGGIDYNMITCMRIEIAELRKDVQHLSRIIDIDNRELKQALVGHEERVRTLEQTRPTWTEMSIITTKVNDLETVSDSRKGQDYIIITAIGAAVAAVTSWVMGKYGG
jgi:hypothetical protein